MTYALSAMIISFKPDWGSQNQDHRLLIRRELQSRFGKHAETDLLDLQIVPRLKTRFVSISHAKGLGGFVVSDRPVGFDIELTSRVRPELAARISSQEEFLAAADPAALWCAKEAVFKALIHGRQPTVVMDMKIEWSGDQFSLVNFADFAVSAGQGEINRHEEYTLGFFETEKRP